jgi:hypothetical protein
VLQADRTVTLFTALTLAPACTSSLAASTLLACSATMCRAVAPFCTHDELHRVQCYCCLNFQLKLTLSGTETSARAWISARKTSQWFRSAAM